MEEFGAWLAAAELSTGVQLPWGHVSGALARAHREQEAVSLAGSGSGSGSTPGQSPGRPSRPRPQDSGALPVPRESPWQRTPGPGLGGRRPAQLPPPRLRWRAVPTRLRPKSAGGSSRTSSPLLNNSSSAPGDRRELRRPGPRCLPLPQVNTAPRAPRSFPRSTAPRAPGSRPQG